MTHKAKCVAKEESHLLIIQALVFLYLKGQGVLAPKKSSAEAFNCSGNLPQSTICDLGDKLGLMKMDDLCVRNL